VSYKDISNYRMTNEIHCEAHRHAKFGAPVFVLLLAVLTSAHVIFIDALGARFELQVVMCLAALWVLLRTVRVGLNSTGVVLIFLTITMFIGELLYRYQLNKLAGFVLAILLVYIVLVTKRVYLIQFINSLHKFNIFFSLLAILSLALSIWHVEVFKALLNFSVYYNNEFPTGMRLLSLLGHADTWIVVDGIKVPRVVGHLNQASLVPAYILLPLSIVLVFSRVRPIGVLILIAFVLITMGGTSYFALVFATSIYMFSRFVPRQLLIVFPFIFAALFLAFLGFVFYDIFDPNAIKQITRVAADGVNQDDVVSNRLGSGLSRLMLISFAAIEHIQTFPFPADTKVLSLTIGSNIITSGLRGGFLATILSIILFYKLFALISNGLNNRRSNSRWEHCGYSLMYSLVFQAMVYNDYGFSTYYCLVMYACILVLADRNRKPKNQITLNSNSGGNRLSLPNVNAQPLMEN